MTHIHEQELPPTGPAAAAFVAAGIGCLALGAFTTFAEISPAVKDFLNWWNPAGPLAGKTSMAIIVWLLAWAVLHVMWKDRSVNFGRMFAISLVLVAFGLIGTFPTFFEAFSH